MKLDKDDDAYPTEKLFRNSYGDVTERSTVPGMSIRTYLAAHAPMDALLLDGCSGSYDLSDKAALAVRWADALIEELNR